MSEWETMSTENIVHRAKSRIYYLRAKVRGKIIRRFLKVKFLRIAKLKRDETITIPSTTHYY